MRAILIDPVAKSLTEVVYDGDWKTIAPLIGCDLFTIVRIENEDAIFVDDEGLLKEDQHFFEYAGYPQPLAGKGLVLGTDDEGESVACVGTIEQMERNIRWHGCRPDWRL